MDLSQYKHNIVVPALALLPTRLNSVAAVNQITGTCLAESDLLYIKQLGTGPACGLNQMEPTTHNDCWRFLKEYSDQTINTAITQYLGSRTATADLMIHDLFYAVMMTRVKYLMSPQSVPAYNNATAMATWHKTWYNTAGGAAVISTNVPKFAAAIAV